MMPRNMHPLERLLNLVAMLLEARRPLTFEQIREALPAYAHDDAASAKRMFERDKDILRDNGIPIEMRPLDPLEIEEGYVIPKERYYLPEISFTAEEISALFVAAHSGDDGSSAEHGVRKLLYGAEGGVLAALGDRPLAAGPDVDADRLHAIADAVLRGSRCIAFGYTTSQGVSSERRLDAYGLVWRGGHWYVVGLDREREETRAFRLSRMTTDVRDAGEGSEPPPGFRASDHVDAPRASGERSERATIALSPDIAWWAADSLEGAEVGPAGADGWVSVRVPAASVDALASWVLGFGPDARALAPDSLREEVVRRLEGVLAG
jgi:proteasome accessory factor B